MVFIFYGVPQKIKSILKWLFLYILLTRKPRLLFIIDPQNENNQEQNICAI